LKVGRREILAALAVGVAGCGASSSSSARGRTPMPARSRTIPETDFAIRTAYPAMPPLGDAVYARRRSRARELARAFGADAVLATSGAASFAYLVGADFGRSERLIAYVLPCGDRGDRGEGIVFAPSFEVERVRRGARAVTVRGWEEQESPVAVVAAWLAAAPGSPRALLVEPRTEYFVAAAFARAMPGATLVDGTRAFEDLRAVKSDEEIERMRRAVAITEDAFAATFERLEMGMLEKDVAKIAREEQARRGADGYALVQFGANAALPHGGPTSTPLRAETGVLLDGGCSFQGWQSDVSRTRWFGRSPSDRFRAVYDVVHDAQSAAIARVRPGVPAQEIDRAARELIARAGFGPQFTHRLGHGIGMEGHEAVYLVEGNARPLERGLVFSVEPGIYLPGELGVRLEEQVACTADGAEVLTRRAPRIGR
jgi:Xaa-Pro dipeptidase